MKKQELIGVTLSTKDLGAAIRNVILLSFKWVGNWQPTHFLVGMSTETEGNHID